MARRSSSSVNVRLLAVRDAGLLMLLDEFVQVGGSLTEAFPSGTGVAGSTISSRSRAILLRSAAMWGGGARDVRCRPDRTGRFDCFVWSLDRQVFV